ncbi:Protein-lysine N-methyltransferase EFM2, partial [Pseudocercospora fuligena]
KYSNMSISPSRSFQIKANEKGQTIPIQISELAGIKAENLGLATWGASVVLANVLYRWKIAEWVTSLQNATSEHNITSAYGRENFKNGQNVDNEPKNTIPILELGSGTGLSGLTASNLWSLPAILTDLPSIIPGIDLNISLNTQTTRCFSGSLDWTFPTTLHIPSTNTTFSTPSSSASIILAADTCYTSSHPNLISTTVSHWLARERNSRAIFCYPLRMAYVDHARNLWEKMEEKGFVCLEEGKETSGGETYGEFERDLPYEWSVWGWREFHPEAAAKREEEKGQSVWMSW